MTNRINIDGVDVEVEDGDPRLSPPIPPQPAAPPAVTGNQWALAISDLGLAGHWLAGKQKSKLSDQIRLDLIARDTPLVASDPLLIRVAGNAGQDGAGAPLIDVPTVFAHAQGIAA